MSCIQDSIWGLMDQQSTEHNRLLDDRSWAIVGDRFSETDMGKGIGPEEEEQLKQNEAYIQKI